MFPSFIMLHYNPLWKQDMTEEYNVVEILWNNMQRMQLLEKS